MMTTAAFAAASNSLGGGDQAIVINGQVNLGTVWSSVNTSVHNIHGDVDASSTAVGNNVQIVTFADSVVTNEQSNESVIGSELNARVGGVGGNVDLNATSVCNNAGISTDPHLTAVRSNQYCGEGDPSAHVNAAVDYVQGGVGISANAIGNQLEVDSNANKFPVTSSQINAGSVISNVNARINHAGAASVSSSAVGNTAQIIHY